MAQDREFEVPPAFTEYLDEHDRRARALAEARAQRRKKDLKAEQRQREEKEVEVKASIKYADEVFRWVAAFRASEVGKRAISALPTSSRPTRSLVFFEWHHGWSYLLSTTDNGIRWYRFGPGSREVCCTTPEELARAVGPDMLKAACNAIKHGEVWNWIKKDLQLFVRGPS